MNSQRTATIGHCPLHRLVTTNVRTHLRIRIYLCTACDNYYAVSLASSRFPLLTPPFPSNKTGYRREGRSTRDWYVVDEDQKSASAVPPRLHSRISLMLLILPRSSMAVLFAMTLAVSFTMSEYNKKKETLEKYHEDRFQHLASPLSWRPNG